MSISRKNDKREKIQWVWTIFLSIVLLFGQGVKLHVHDLDHGQDQQHSHDFFTGDAEHSNVTNAHLSLDNSHSDHHAEIALEIDMSKDALLKDLSSEVLTLGLLFTILVFFLPGFYRLSLPRLYSSDALFPRRYLFSPPLRAPPL